MVEVFLDRYGDPGFSGPVLPAIAKHRALPACVLMMFIIALVSLLR